MMRSWALFWSGFFHPIFVPTYIILLAFWLQPFELLYYPSQVKVMVILQVLVLATLLPLAAVYLLLHSKMIGSIMVEERQERNLPYLIQALCLASLLFLFRRVGLSNLLFMPIAGAMLAVLAAWYINRYWKISAHAIGMGGFLGFLWSMHGTALHPVYWPLLLSIIFAGIVGSARLQLSAHSPAQVYLGYAIGVASMLLTLLPYWTNNQ